MVNTFSDHSVYWKHSDIIQRQLHYAEFLQIILLTSQELISEKLHYEYKKLQINYPNGLKN